MSSHHKKLDPSDPQNYYCRNCNHNHGTVDVHFCANCGQKNTDGRTSMHEIGHEFLHNTLHLDGKFFKMLRHLFLPGKLTADFFLGRQKRYPHPTRFFLVIVALFLFIFNSVNNLKVKSGSQATTTKSKYLLGLEVRSAFDSLPRNLRTPESLAAIDSVFETTALGTPQDSFHLNTFGESFSFSMDDAVRLTPDSLIKKHKIKGFMAQKALKQALKSYDDPKSILHAWLSTVTATILLLLTLMSPILLLLFRKTRPFYVEHFIFLMHHTTTLLLGMSVLMLLMKIGGLKSIASNALIVWWIGWMSAGMLLAMKRFYDRKWSEIVGKWFIFSLTYAIVGIIAVILSVTAAFFFLL